MKKTQCAFYGECLEEALFLCSLFPVPEPRCKKHSHTSRVFKSARVGPCCTELSFEYLVKKAMVSDE